jgi:hypothetical protein
MATCAVSGGEKSGARYELGREEEKKRKEKREREEDGCGRTSVHGLERIQSSVNLEKTDHSSLNRLIFPSERSEFTNQRSLWKPLSTYQRPLRSVRFPSSNVL